jgi:aminopeptidase N
MKFRSLLLIFTVLLASASCKTMKERRIRKAYIKDSIRIVEAFYADSIAAVAYSDEWSEGDFGEYYEEDYSSGEVTPVYQSAKTRSFDLLHTRLEVSFDWTKSQMPGKAWLKFKPFFYASKTLVLDAKGFELKKVALVTPQGMTDLTYTYDSLKLSINLDREYQRKETLEVYIEYIAKPNDLPEGGSAAITSDKGLYFINADGADPDVPKQIWTQGETESSSCWFPTIDAPNERTTQELSMTVENKYVTLSNGKLMKQTNNPDGTRTDYWSMDLPHAPYLFMMAVGEFSIVKDQCCGGMEVNYYVEKKYEPYAKLIFGKTPEMIQFFGDRLGYPYPWPKFSQIVVRDFVSGAMENTSAVVHFGGLQHDSRDHLDETYEDIISHELFHHWFGDLVTCESWSNISLNESFATYGEYLWREFKYGRESADEHLLEDQTSYMFESAFKQEPLIRYKYENREDVFDSHSYQKGGCILHMLRKFVGDEAFFESLKLYLTRNAFTDVEAHELRLAFEEVTGQDLNWFWDQWFFKSGHPRLTISVDMEYDSTNISMNVYQHQDWEDFYRFPVKLELVTGDQHEFRDILLSCRDTTYIIPYTTKPDYVVFDAEQIILGDIYDERPIDQWIAQLTHASNYIQRSRAITKLSEETSTPEVIDALMAQLKNSFAGTRLHVINVLTAYFGVRRMEFIESCKQIAATDPEAKVRAAALNAMNDYAMELDNYDASETEAALKRKQDFFTLLGKCIQDSSRSVQSTALGLLYKADHQEGAKAAATLKSEKNSEITAQVANILLLEHDPSALDFVVEVLQSADNPFSKYSILQTLIASLESQSGDVVTKAIGILKDFTAGEDEWWMRAMTARGLQSYLDRDGVRAFLQEQLDKEKNEEMQDVLRGILSE